MIIKQEHIGGTELGVVMLTSQPWGDGLIYRVMAQFACGSELADKKFKSKAKAEHFYNLLTRTPVEGL
jgi:hypothetical protein